MATTTDSAGLAVRVALCGLALAVPLRAAGAMAPPEKARAVFASAAVAGHRTQLMLLFDTPAGLLISTLLLAFAARLEVAALPEQWRLRLPALRGAAPRQWRKARLALADAAVLAALAGLATNRGVLVSADARYLDERAVLTGATAVVVDASPINWRRRIFEVPERHWPQVRSTDPHAAMTLLAWAGREAATAVRTEPVNWRIARTLARLYEAVAATEPGHAGEAGKHMERSLALAPNRDVFPVRIVTPRGLEAEPRDDGRLLLRWQPSPSAGFHVILRARGGAPLRQFTGATTRAAARALQVRATVADTSSRPAAGQWCARTRQNGRPPNESTNPGQRNAPLGSPPSATALHRIPLPGNRLPGKEAPGTVPDLSLSTKIRDRNGVVQNGLLRPKYSGKRHRA